MKKIRIIMSQKHWQLRRKGMSYRQAFIEVRNKAISLKIRKPYRDSDKDGTINRYDCQPKNRYKQDQWTAKRFIEYNKNDKGDNLQIEPDDVLSPSELRKYNDWQRNQQIRDKLKTEKWLRSSPNKNNLSKLLGDTQ